MTERKKDRGSNLGKGSSNSGVLWSLTMTRWKEELLSKHQHSGILYWESPTTTPLSVGLASSPRTVPHASLLHAISQQSKPGRVEQRSKKVSTDRPGLLVPSGIYVYESFTEAIPRNPFFYYSASPAPVLLSSSNQHSELGGVSNMASGIKAAPVTTHNSWARSETVKSECGTNGRLKCAQADMKERALTHSYAQIWWHSGWNYSQGWPGADYRGPALGSGCCVPLTPTSPLSVVFPLHSSLHAFTHAPQSQLSSGSRQPLRESMGT